MMDFELAKWILAAFETEGVRYVLVGSMGMAVQGLVRATRVMDIFVSPDPDNVRRLKAALRSIFNDPQIEAISAEDLSGTVRPRDRADAAEIKQHFGLEEWRWGQSCKMVLRRVRSTFSPR
jgi:hypothetical protein